MSKAKKIFSVIKDYAHGITPEKRKKLNEEKAIQELRERRAREAAEYTRIIDQYKDSDAAKQIVTKVKERLNWVYDNSRKNMPHIYTWDGYNHQRNYLPNAAYAIIDISSEEIRILSYYYYEDGQYREDNYAKVVYSDEGVAPLTSVGFSEYLAYALNKESDKKWSALYLYDTEKRNTYCIEAGNRRGKLLVVEFDCSDLDEFVIWDGGAGSIIKKQTAPDPSLKSW